MEITSEIKNVSVHTEQAKGCITELAFPAPAQGVGGYRERREPQQVSRGSTGWTHPEHTLQGTKCI